MATRSAQNVVGMCAEVSSRADREHILGGFLEGSLIRRVSGLQTPRPLLSGPVLGRVSFDYFKVDLSRDIGYWLMCRVTCVLCV